jgi:hypothetical protein
MVRDQWINALVAAAKESFADGIDDPSAEELVEHYYEDKVYPRSMVDDAIKRMSKVRHELEADGYRTAPVAEKYYRRGTLNGRPKPVTSLAEAALQLASGYGKRCYGLVHFTGDDESHALIWRAWQKLQTNRNGAALGKNIQSILDAVNSGDLTEIEARTALEDGLLAAAPDAAQLGQVMAAELEE